MHVLPDGLSSRRSVCILVNGSPAHPASEAGAARGVVLSVRALRTYIDIGCMPLANLGPTGAVVSQSMERWIGRWIGGVSKP